MTTSNQEHRASLESFLATLLRRELDKELTESLAQGGALEILETLETGCSDYIKNFDKEAQERAAEEFTRLFLLHPDVRPQMSSQGGKVHGEQGAQLNHHALACLALETSENLPKDHFSITLSLLAEARLRGREDLHQSLEKAFTNPAIHFAQQWLWHTNNPLYRSAAKLMLQLFSIKKPTTVSN